MLNLKGIKVEELVNNLNKGEHAYLYTECPEKFIFEICRVTVKSKTSKYLTLEVTEWETIEGKNINTIKIDLQKMEFVKGKTNKNCDYYLLDKYQVLGLVATDYTIYTSFETKADLKELKREIFGK